MPDFDLNTTKEYLNQGEKIIWREGGTGSPAQILSKQYASLSDYNLNTRRKYLNQGEYPLWREGGTGSPAQILAKQ